ncbi:hypothetical protein MTR67_042736 [Solanum verrucosum]|uniref:DUF4283 domain-containing protein n=1 Tax=Solanum verrucosum TaxID=315347 RepID=A0AAF0ZS19_SOLVR|nr:hypothetical protein MTR67_042736 [Solanum verrucosum]
MDPSDGPDKARLKGQQVPPREANQPTVAIVVKNSYANTLCSSLISPQTPNTMDARQYKELVQAKQATHIGVPVVLFKASDYYGIMVAECRFTIVGRFVKPRPQIDKIRSKFKELVTIKGSTKIGEQQMWLQKWTLDFKPEEDLPIAPVWILLPKLPFHMHTWQYIKQIVSSVGTPLEKDQATKSRTRPSMAKVRVEIDLLKPQPESVYVGLIHENSPQTGFMQKLEYEGIPKYCKHCKKLGHVMANCRVLERKKAIEQQKLEEQVNTNEIVEQSCNGKEAEEEDVQKIENKSNGVTSNNVDQEIMEAKASINERTSKKNRKEKKKKLPKKKSKIQLKPNFMQQVGKYINRKNIMKYASKNKALEETIKTPTNPKNNRKLHDQQDANKEDAGQSKPSQQKGMEDGKGIEKDCMNNMTISSKETDHLTGSSKGSSNRTQKRQTHDGSRQEKSEKIPSLIKNMKGLNLVVDLNQPNIPKQVTNKQSEKNLDPQYNVISPNKVVVVVSDKQMQQQQVSEDTVGFTPVIQKGDRNKKGNKKQKEENSNVITTKEARKNTI